MLNALGIVLQVVGAGVVVWASFRTRMQMARFSEKVTYVEAGGLIDKLRSELADAYSGQAVGFVFILAGAMLQLASALV